MTAARAWWEPTREGSPGAWTEIATHTVLGSYLRETSQPIYSLLFLIPLLGAYELLAVFVNFDRTLQIRNAADIMVKNVLLSLGIRSMLGFVLAVVLVAIVCALVALRDSRGPIRPRYFAGMFLESCVYATLLGTIAGRFTDIVLGARGAAPLVAGAAGTLARPVLSAGGGDGPLWTGSLDVSQLMIALGAGVYEEIVFRVLLISVLLYLFELLSGFRPLAWLVSRRGALLAAGIAALLFSGFHYLGEHGDLFLWTTFVYRFAAGLVLAVIYVFRGVGVAAWTHALYDVSLLLPG